MSRHSAKISSPRLPEPVDVLFVCMPFGVLTAPALGAALLTASLPRRVRAGTLYLTMQFADLIGVPLYQQISWGKPAFQDLVGEWIFSAALFEDSASDPQGYIRDVLQGLSPAHRPAGAVSKAFLRGVLAARDQAGDFVESCCGEVLAHRPKMICFSSVFQQHAASLALARRLKRREPTTPILFGGANCEGPMGVELVRQFPFVDAAVSGEADVVFPELARRALAGEPFDGIPGVYTAAAIGRPGFLPGRAPAVQNLDDLPLPVFDDFFDQWSAFSKRRPDDPVAKSDSLLFETSRGCWWGAKHHCTFCGLNGASMAYRSKSASRASKELLQLTSRHPGKPVTAVDNILDMKYFEDFIPWLAQHDFDLRLSYEVKANLRKDQLRLLRDAQVVSIHAGVESLSTPLLRRMRKGVTALQNLQILKWCRELGVKALWNLLWGFPGEAPQEYEKMARSMPFLFHLDPPVWVIPIRIDRFSPYHESPESFGLAEVRPYPSYSHVYPFEAGVLANLAYYFTARSQAENGGRHIVRLNAAVRQWRSAHAQSDLFFADQGERLLVFDTRPVARQPLTEISGIARLLYLECDAVRSTTQMQRLLRNQRRLEVSNEELEQTLEPLVEAGLMIREEDSYLSLAVAAGENMPKTAVLQRFFAVLQESAATARSSRPHSGKRQGRVPSNLS